MTTSYITVLNTCPDQETAQKVANLLVEERLAACVNILPGLTSVYHWKGQVESASEYLLIIKTTAALFRHVAKIVTENHPCELPEVIAVPIVDGLSGYLQWIDDNTASPK